MRPHNPLLPIATLQFTVLVWAATALFAKLIDLPAESIIYLRSVPALVLISASILLLKPTFRLSLKSWGVSILIGLLMAGHWVSFYASVQRSSVAVGLITLYCFPLLTSLVEPLVLKSRPDRTHLVLAIFGLGGVALIAWESLAADVPLIGVWLGLLSAAFFTGRNLASKYKAQHIPSLTQMWIQLATTFLLLGLFLGVAPFQNTSAEQWQLLILLGTLFVALPHTLFLYCLKHINAATASLMSMIQPVYAIALAALVLHEIPSLHQILGGAVILVTATLATRETLK